MKYGDRIYYTGDRANQSGWATVQRINLVSQSVDLAFSDGREFRGVMLRQIGNQYHGHHNPRFVTEAAYIAYSQARMTQMIEAVLARFDLEASETPRPFPGHAMRAEMRNLLEQATGKSHANKYTEAS